MKTLTIILIAALSFAVMAQTEKVVENAPVNYLKGLKSNNTGVVESAIFHSLKYKLYYPEANTAKLEKQIEKLVAKGKSNAIRYKAFLANQFMKNDTLRSKIAKEDYKDAEEFFRMLSVELSTHFLAVK